MIRSTRECKHVRRVEGAGRLAKKVIFPYDTPAMETLGQHCSMAERRADDATRDVVDFLKCEYMEQHVGDVFEGTITAVTGFGLFVSLNDVFVEGLVHISNLNNDFYQFDQVKHRLVGERTRKTFRLGDTLWIQVMGVSLDDRKIDFGLAADPGDQSATNSDQKPRRRKVAEKESNTEGDKKKRRGPRRNNRKKTTNTGKSSDGAAAKKASTKKTDSSKSDSPAKKKKRPMSKRQKLNGAQAKSKSQSAESAKTRKPKKPGSAKKKAKKSNAKAHND